MYAILCLGRKCMLYYIYIYICKSINVWLVGEEDAQGRE
jgi:hypothetical protein